MSHREAVSKALGRSLDNDDVNVVVFSGKWGSGKTYLWNEFSKDYLNNKTDKPYRMYCYVSLFGLEGIVDMKRSVASEWIFSSNSNLKEKWSSKINKHLPKKVKEYLPKALKGSVVTDALIKNFPLLGQNYDLGVDMALASVSNSLICIDDLERRSDKFDLLPVLGFAENLASKQNCKVVLILNSGSLDGDEKVLYDKYHEKVVDREIQFDPPTSNNSALICDGTEEFDTVLREVVDQLDITNLRIIKRIRSYTYELLGIIDRRFEGLTQLIATSVALIANLEFNKEDDLPDIEFLRSGYLRVKHGANAGLDKDVENKAQHRAWAEYISRCGWGVFNNFDEVIYDYIVTGILSRGRFLDAVKEMSLEHESGEVASEVKQAWCLYYETFDDNEELFLDKLYSTYYKYSAATAVNNINAAVATLREYGREANANDLCRHWVETKLEHDPKTLDVNQLHWPNDLTDEVLKDSMREAHLSNIGKIRLFDVFIMIYEDKAVSDDPLAVFSNSLSREIECEIRDIRSTNVFVKTRKILRYSKHVDSVVGGNANKLKVILALKNIGEGSKINLERTSTIINADS